MAEFIQNLIDKTKSEHMSVPPQEGKVAPQPPLELPFPDGTNFIMLPSPAELDVPEIGLRAAVEHRRTLRKYSQAELTLTELSYLLWMTQGVKEVTDRPATLRNVPSAGARHAFETYLLVNRVEGLEPGLYRFAASRHALAQVHGVAHPRADLTHACYEQRQISNSAVTFLWVAVSERMTWRYVERGFRYLLLDAGHVCQNLCLAAEAIDCGVCPIAAFNDDQVNLVLGVDGSQQWTVYLGSVGKR
jgi:SagB-type dehydrogenase family enzyme